jgi:hypothetical protein
VRTLRGAPPVPGAAQMNRPILNRITRRLSARRVAAKRAGRGAKAHITEKQRKIIHELMRP